MVTIIAGIREQHLVRDKEQLLVQHRAMIQRQAGRGARVAVHTSNAPKTAYIDLGRWVIDCDCGAGNATDPEWGIACCFACGAVHVSVVFPEDRTEVERILLLRPESKTRNWKPQQGETAVLLAEENQAHGLRF
jgi:hypothetical protein